MPGKGLDTGGPARRPEPSAGTKSFSPPGFWGKITGAVRAWKRPLPALPLAGSNQPDRSSGLALGDPLMAGRSVAVAAAVVIAGVLLAAPWLAAASAEPAPAPGTGPKTRHLSGLDATMSTGLLRLDDLNLDPQEEIISLLASLPERDRRLLARELRHRLVP